MQSESFDLNDIWHKSTDEQLHALMNDVGFKPNRPVEQGVKNFVDWYKGYYQV